MSTDDPRTLLHDVANCPVEPLDHDELRRRARNRTRSTLSAATVAVLAAVVGVGALVMDMAAPPSVDVVHTPGGTVAPADPLPGLPEFPVTLDLPPAGEVTAVHVGERPVFVVHRDTGQVLVLDAISPHRAETELPKVVAFCRDPWVFETKDEQTVVTTPGGFRDLWHGSLFALDGSWLGNPSPTGLPTYEVRSIGSNAIEIGPPGPAPDRDKGPFSEVLGPRNNINSRPLSQRNTNCQNEHDQTRSATPPDDPTAVLWHDAQHSDRWLYPFSTAGEQTPAEDNLGPLVERERSTSQHPTDGAPVEAALITLAFITAIGAFAFYLRRREADGSLDADPSSMSRPGLRRLLDFGQRGWSKDGKNQPPKD